MNSIAKLAACLISTYDQSVTFTCQVCIAAGFEERRVPCTQSSQRLFISGLAPLFGKQPLREALHPPFSLHAALDSWRSLSWAGTASALALLSSNPWCRRRAVPPTTSPSQFSSWGCLMSLRRVSPNGSFIVTAAGNGSWEAVDGSSLLLPPLANALFYQPGDERTAAPRPRVRPLFLRHAACCYANRLSESSFCSAAIHKHPLQCKHKVSL